MVSLFANYVDETKWGEIKVNSITLVEGEAADSYALLNFAAVHRLFGGSSEVSLSVFNLLGSKHLEHPEGTEYGRSALLKLICRI